MGFISLLLFLVGFFAYFSKQKHLTLIAIIVLASQYFRMVDANFTIGSLSLQHGDMALLLTFSLLPFRKPFIEPGFNKIRIALFVFFGFLMVSIFFDLLMRETTLMQIFRTTRKTGYLVFFFLINSFTYRDYKKLINFLLVVTLIHSILYITQYILGYAFLPGNVSENEMGGHRFDNSPSFTIPLFAYSVFVMQQQKTKLTNLIIFLTVIVLGQSRGAIISAISIILMYSFLYNKLKLVPTIIATVILILGYNITMAFFPIIEERFVHLFSEIDMIGEMNYNNLNDFYHEGSFIFRWGLTYERFMYVLEEPSRIFLGVGYVPDIDIKQQIFTIGTHSPMLPTGFEQYNSIDILFPNIITRYGIMGSVIFLFLIYHLFVFAIKKKAHLWGKILLAYLVSMAFISLINETFYNGFYFIMIFIFLGLISTGSIQTNKNNNEYSI